MLISQDGLRLIQAWEALAHVNGDGSVSPYIDSAGVYTIGWGHALKTVDGQNISTNTFGASKARVLAASAMSRMFGAQTISQEQAQALFEQDAAHWSASLTQSIGQDNATQNEFDAMVCFSYNVGIGNFNSSHVKSLHMSGQRTIGDVSLHALCQESQGKADPTTMAIAFSRWSNVNGAWSLGVFRRRISEMMIYGGHDYDTSIQTAKAFHP